MARVTIKDVASAANVSPSTVSNLLNGRTARMTDATRNRILQTIKELGYRPHRAARELRTGRVGTIGLVVPSVGNPFWGAFASEIEAAARGKARSVRLCNSERDADRERMYIEEMLEDGISDIVLCSSLPSLAHLAPMILDGLNLVTFDRPSQLSDPDSIVSISIDNRVGGYLAAKHLVDLGHTDIAFLSGTMRSLNRANRYHGFREALEEAGLEVRKPTTPESHDDDPLGDTAAADLGRKLVHRLAEADRMPTGIVAINDMTALGICQGLRDVGLRVGKDVSVVGFDDIVLADLIDPPLTTVRQPIAEMAKIAVAALSNGPEVTLSRSVLLRPTLRVRSSTSAPPSHVGKTQGA